MKTFRRGISRDTGDVEYVLFNGTSVSSFSGRVPYDCDFVVDASFKVISP